MTPWWAWFLIAGVPMLIVILIVTNIVQQRRRRAALRDDCAMRGWTYHAKGTWHERLARHPFGKGHSRRSRDCIEGSHGSTGFQAFTYQFNTSGNKGQQHVHSFTVLLYLMTSGHDGVVIRHRHLGHRIMALFGKGPRTTGNETFDKKWVAQRADKSDPVRVDHSIQKVIMMSPKLRWDWQGDTLRVVRGGVLRIDRLEWMLEQAKRFREAAGDDSW